MTKKSLTMLVSGIIVVAVLLTANATLRVSIFEVVGTVVQFGLDLARGLMILIGFPLIMAILYYIGSKVVGINRAPFLIKLLNGLVWTLATMSLHALISQWLILAEPIPSLFYASGFVIPAREGLLEFFAFLAMAEFVFISLVFRSESS